MTTASQTPGEPADFDVLFVLALREHNAGRFAEAAAAYRKILALRPDSAKAHHNLGNVLLRQGVLEEAAVQYERALALNPRLFPAHNELGCVLQQQGKVDQAAASFSQALALNPQYVQAHNNLAGVLKQQGKFDEALASYDQVLALKPDLAEAHCHRTELKTFRAGDPDLAALEALAAGTHRLPPAKMVYVHFAPRQGARGRRRRWACL